MTNSRQAKTKSGAGWGPGRYYGALVRLARQTVGASASRRQALALIEEISAQLHRVAVSRASEANLHPTDIQVLSLLRLAGQDGVMPAIELQRALGFTPGGVTRRLDAMCTNQLVERIADPKDGRAWLVRLTPTGASMIDDRMAPGQATNGRIESAFTEAEWASLIALLQRLLNAMTAQSGDDAAQ